jgi:ComF family protein
MDVPMNILKTMKISDVWQSFLDVLMPRLCPVCGKPLTVDEKCICRGCMLDLPRTRLHERKFNDMEQLFAGKVAIERASGYFYYERDSDYAAILHAIKYYNQPYTARWLASEFAREAEPSGIFADIDCIVPVPLHRSKLAKRGYNQSEMVAHGISDRIGAPVVKGIVATRPHSTQTRKGAYERWLNTQNIYAASNPEQFEGKHVLIVDDVITTGATLLACAKTLENVTGIRISLATLAVARLE